MAKEEEENTANQTPEGGAQEDTANQTAQGSAEQTTGIKDDTPGAGESDGLKQAVVAEQKRRQDAEARAMQAEMQAQILQEQMAQGQQQQPQIDPEEYVQYGTVQNLVDQKVNTVVQAMQEQAFQSQSPDHQDILGSGTGRGFRPSEKFTDYIKNNPNLAGLEQAVASGNAQAKMVAYSLVKQYSELSELRKAQTASKERERMQNVDTQTAPMSAAAAGGGTSLESQIPNENTDEFDAFYARVANGEFDSVRS